MKKTKWGYLCKADFNTERKKISEQTDKERENLFYQIKETMNGIYKQGGRNTESDLFGENGKYVNSPTKSEQETDWY